MSLCLRRKDIPNSARMENAVAIVAHRSRSASKFMTSPSWSYGWPTFTDILKRLHDEGIYIHHEQLAEFLLCHGLPVDLKYVPPHLKTKAEQINQNYQGDMACMAAKLEEPNFVECYRDVLLADPFT